MGAARSLALSMPADATVSARIGSVMSGATPLSPRFSGLSFEKSQMSFGLFSPDNAALIQWLNNLGPGVLRIGGNAANTTAWNDSCLTGACDANGRGTTYGYVSPADVDQLAAFLRKTPGWKVIYGVNFDSLRAPQTPARMAAEVAYVQNRLGPALMGFELGNEPNNYVSEGVRAAPYTVDDFIGEWNSYAATIRASTPDAVLTGPAATSNLKGQNYVAQFAARTSGPAIDLLTQHYYIAGAKTQPTIASMLGDDAALASLAQNLANTAGHAGIAGGARLAEANNYSGGGAPGVSNSFASALWVVNFMFALNRYGLAGANLHTGNSASYAPLQTACADGTSPAPIPGQNHCRAMVKSAQPMYYGLWLFAQAASQAGTRYTVSVDGNASALSVHDVAAADGSHRVVLLNASARDEQVAVSGLPSAARTASVSVLSASGGLSDTEASHVTINGARFDAQGNLSYAPQVQTVAGGSVTVRVPAGAAALVVVR